MKNIKVQMSTLLMKGMFATNNDGVKEVNLSVSDEIAAILRQLLQTLPLAMDGKRVINSNDLSTFIQNGHSELEQVRQLIVDCHRELVSRERIARTNKLDLDGVLPSAFFDDIEEGLYKPALSFDEFRDYKADTADDQLGEELEEYIEDLYYNKYREVYLNWVMSHLSEDYRFVADRLGVDLTDVYDGSMDEQLYFVITNIEE